jgi:hypothetical protein
MRTTTLAVTGILMLIVTIGGALILVHFRSAQPTPPSVGAAIGEVPRPPRGALVLAKQDGMRAVGLAVRAVRKRLEVTVTVAGPSGPASGLNVSLDVSSNRARVSTRARPCGPGCYRAAADLASAPKRVRVTLSEGQRRHAILFTLPAQWPARSADALLGSARRIFRSLRSVAFDETLSDGRNTVVSHWELEAPNSLTYRIRGGSSAVIISGRRWDKLRGQRRWIRSSAVPVHQPTTIWSAGSYDTHVVGSGRVGGRPTVIVSFVDPKGPAWFTVWLDKRTTRPLALRMTAAAHFMQHRYSSFNAPLKISPPTR